MLRQGIDKNFSSFQTFMVKSVQEMVNKMSSMSTPSQDNYSPTNINPSNVRINISPSVTHYLGYASYVSNMHNGYHPMQHTPPSPHIHYIICLRLKKFVFLYSRRDSLLLLFLKQVYLYFAVFTIYVVCMKEELCLNFA